MICNGGINPYHQPISKAVINVPAGAQVTAEWHHTLAGADPSDSADPVDPSHKGMHIYSYCGSLILIHFVGPVISYLYVVHKLGPSDIGLK